MAPVADAAAPSAPPRRRPDSRPPAVAGDAVAAAGIVLALAGIVLVGARPRRRPKRPPVIGRARPIAWRGHARHRARPGRQPLQAPRLRVPVGGDLRRLPLHLRLRPARRAAAAQREGRVVALDGAAARRRRRPRRRHPRRRRRSGRPRGHLANFTDPLVDCTKCKQRFRLDKLDDPDTCPNCGAQGQLHRGPPVQPDVQDLRRPGGGGRRRSPTCARRRPRACSSTSPTCCRPRRKKPPFGIAQVGKSFRNEITPRQLRSSAPASSSRWRWSSSCRRPRRRSGTSTGAPSGCDWYVDLGIPADDAAPAGPRRRRAVALLGGHVRRRVPLPVGLGRARGHRQPHRLRPHAARQALGRAARLLRPGDRTSATCRT